MFPSDFVNRARKRPAPDNFDNHHERIKNIALSSRRTKPHYLYRSDPSYRMRVLSPVPSTPRSWDADRHSDRPQRDVRAFYMKSSGSRQREEGPSSRRQGGSPRYGYTNRMPSGSGVHEPIQARSRLPISHYSRAKATSYKTTAKNPRLHPPKGQLSHMAAQTIKHELTHPPEAAGVEVVYTKNVLEAETWLRKHITECSATAVGFDIEWKPQFVSKKRGGTESKTAVLQLGVDTSCLVLHIYHMSNLPDGLVAVLTDKKVLKIGSGIKQDVSKLRRDRGLVCQGFVDTQDVAKSLDLSTQKVGLKALAERFLGITLAKSKRVATSNWEKFPLTLRQIEYAALDAWIGLKVFNEMEHRRSSYRFSKK